MNMVEQDFRLLAFHGLMFLVSFIDFLVYTSIIILIVTLQLNMNNRCGEMTQYNYVYVTTILSSFGRGVLLFMLVWEYPVLFIKGVDVFVLTSNVVALNAFLDTSWIDCSVAVFSAHVLKVAVHEYVKAILVRPI